MAKKKRAPGSKTRTWQIPVEPDLDENAKKYAREHGFSLSAIIRAIARVWFDPHDPRPLPPNIERETKRPPRKK